MVEVVTKEEFDILKTAYAASVARIDVLTDKIDSISPLTAQHESDIVQLKAQIQALNEELDTLQPNQPLPQEIKDAAATLAAFVVSH